jgi:ABC-type molybdate transport system substrate-binding protein
MVRRITRLAASIAFASTLFAQTAKREVAIAAAANLNEVFQVIGSQFEAATGIHPTFSFASTAQLALQIEQLAPATFLPRQMWNMSSSERRKVF